MTTSLKERYEQKQITRLQMKVRRIDRLMNEGKLYLVSEAFDKKQMESALDIIKKLKAIDFGKIKPLNDAKNACIKDITAAMGAEKGEKSGKIKGFFKKMLKRNVSDNPLIDALAFADSIKNFFEDFNTFIKGVIDEKYKDESLKAAIEKQFGFESQTESLKKRYTKFLFEETPADKPDALGQDKALRDKEEKEQKKSKEKEDKDKEKEKFMSDMEKIIKKGLAPSAEELKGSKWIDKYLKGDAGIKAVVQSVMELKPSELEAAAKSSEAAFKTAEEVGRSAVGAGTQTAEKTKSSTSGEQTAGASTTKPAGTTTDTTGGTAVAGAADKKDTGASPPIKEKVNQTVAKEIGKNDLKKAISSLGMSEKGYNLLIDKLIQKGHIKEARFLEQIIKKS
jgi:hypothetical protein